ncbi:MAG: cysteine rich repeat-containing protein [Smithella sp.]
MKILRLMLIVAAIFCLISSLVFSQEREEKGACKADAEKFCKDVEPVHGNMAQCMKQHEAELSPACKERIAAANEKVKECEKECKPDVEKICKDIKPGQGRIVRCLKQHQAELSAGCSQCFKK